VIRFQLFEVFSLLIGILIFDLNSNSTSSEVVTFEIIVFVVFSSLVISMFTTQICCVVKRAKTDFTLENSNAVHVEVGEVNVRVSDAWIQAMPEIRFSTNPLNEGTLNQASAPKKKIIVASVSSQPNVI
jgi:hypothetical protein